MKSIGNIAKYTLLLTLVDCGFNSDINWTKQASAFAVDGRVVKKKSLFDQMTLFISNSDTMIILLKR
jgi:hypothetical protein